LVGFDLVKFKNGHASGHGHGVEFAQKAFCVSFFKECLANGVILMGYTPRVRLHPPLILTMDEATRALEVIDHALTSCEAH
jgi:4-aminobutyrate aminotransferase-like enzyme